MEFKLKSIELIDELLNEVSGSEDDGDLAAVEVLSMIKSLIIQDFFSDAFIPRSKVQAAVDRLVESSVPSDCECPTCDAIRAMCRELGVAPYEVQ